MRTIHNVSVGAWVDTPRVAPVVDARVLTSSRSALDRRRPRAR